MAKRGYFIREPFHSSELNNNACRKSVHFYSNETEAFPVCGLPPSNASRNAVRSPAAPPHRFNLSLCSATMSSTASRAQLVEWIEFHRLVGVQHFFLYDTSHTHSRGLRSSTT